MTNEVAAAVRPVSAALAQEFSRTREAWGAASQWVTEHGLTFLVNAAVALALLAAGAQAIRLLTRMTRRALAKSKRVNALLENFIVSVVQKTSWALLLMIVLQRLGVDVAPLIAGLGVTGFILGFACQESLGNLASGMMIAINQPFSVGDYVELGGIAGSVLELNMMATTLATADNKKVVVPNKVVWGSAITNYSAVERRRVDMTAGIAYGEDISRAREVILGVLAADPRVLKDPAPLVEVSEMGPSSVDFVVRPWAAPGDYWPVYFQTTRAILEALEKNGIAIPFPQMDVHLFPEEKEKKV